MKKRKLFDNCVFIGLGLVIITACVIVTLAVWKWNEPLAAGMELPTYAVTKTSAFNPADSPNSESEETGEGNEADSDPLAGIEIAPTPTPLPPGVDAPLPLCGGPEMMTVLGVGIDTFDDDYLYGLADVIRIVRIDFVTPKVTVLSMPRDIWVEIPGISDHYGITHGKLNQSYFYGTAGMGYYDGPGFGPGLMALTFVQNFDLYIDHYGSINMSTMEKVIDAVGGIDIYLPTDVDGRSYEDSIDLGYWDAGQHHFDGEEAVRFSRVRAVDGVFQRMDRQTMVLYALQDKILSPAVLPRIPAIISSFRDSVITDLSPGDLAVLTCLAPKITKDQLVFVTLPESLLKGDRKFDPHLETNTFVWDADMNVIQQLLGHFQDGTWPAK